jgi:hypothetical protein
MTKKVDNRKAIIKSPPPFQLQLEKEEQEAPR